MKMKSSNNWPVLFGVIALAFGGMRLARAETEMVDGVEWIFTVSGGTASVGSGDYYWGRAVPTSTTGSIVIPSTLGGYPVTGIGYWAFCDCKDLTEVTIPAGVTSIGWEAFSGCHGLTNVTIPDSVTSIEVGAFCDCSRLLAIEAGTGNAAFTSEDGVLFDKDKTTLLQCPAGKIGTYAIPDGVKAIVDHAFGCCERLTSVNIPGSVEYVGWEAFWGCTQLTAVNIHDLSAWCETYFETSMGTDDANPLGWAHHLYLDGEEVVNLTIPEGTGIGHGVFAGCTGLTNVIIPDGVTCIEDWAFAECYGLKSVTIPNSVSSIGEGAFSACTNLEAVNIPDLAAWCRIEFNEGGISEPPLAHATLYVDGEAATDLVIPEGVPAIGDSAFTGYGGLTSVTIPDSVTNIGREAFHYFTNLTTVKIGSGVERIEGRAFYHCNRLTSMTIPDSVTYIGGRAFEYCGGLATLVVPESWEGTSMLNNARVPAECEVIYGVYAEMDGEGNCTVDRGGSMWAERGWSSNPVTAMSLPTVSPRSPMAMRLPAISMPLCLSIALVK